MAKPRKVAKKRFKSAPPVGEAPRAPSRAVLAAFSKRIDGYLRKIIFDKKQIVGLLDSVREKSQLIAALSKSVPGNFSLKPIEEAPKANGFNSFVLAVDETFSMCRRFWWCSELNGEGHWVDEYARAHRQTPIVPKFWVTQAAE